MLSICECCWIGYYYHWLRLKYYEPRRSSVALREVAKLHQIQPADLLRS